MNNGNGFNMVSPEDFRRIENMETKLNIIHGYLHDLHMCDKKTHERIDNIESRKKRDRVSSVVSGGVGGFIAMLIRPLFPGG